MSIEDLQKARIAIETTTIQDALKCLKPLFPSNSEISGFLRRDKNLKERFRKKTIGENEHLTQEAQLADDILDFIASQEEHLSQKNIEAQTNQNKTAGRSNNNTIKTNTMKRSSMSHADNAEFEVFQEKISLIKNYKRELQDWMSQSHTSLLEILSSTGTIYQNLIDLQSFIQLGGSKFEVDLPKNIQKGLQSGDEFHSELKKHLKKQSKIYTLKSKQGAFVKNIDKIMKNLQYLLELSGTHRSDENPPQDNDDIDPRN
jgi:hypothetical protein